MKLSNDVVDNGGGGGCKSEVKFEEKKVALFFSFSSCLSGVKIGHSLTPKAWLKISFSGAMPTASLAGSSMHSE